MLLLLRTGTVSLTTLRSLKTKEHLRMLLRGTYLWKRMKDSTMILLSDFIHENTVHHMLSLIIKHVLITCQSSNPTLFSHSFLFFFLSAIFSFLSFTPSLLHLSLSFFFLPFLLLLLLLLVLLLSSFLFIKY